MRFPVVLFDLDGTLIDSGAMILASFRHATRTVLAREIPPCAGVASVLERLHEEGRRLGVVTAKRQVTVGLAFRVLPLAHLFDAVVASDDVLRNKPYPDGILRALELLEARPDEAAYVGDSPFDVEAARRAGVHSVAVTWGGIHSRETLENARADTLVDSPEEL